MNVIMTEAWSALPNSINIRARGCNDLRACVLCFHCDALPEMLKTKRGGIDGWMVQWVYSPRVKVLFWPLLILYIDVFNRPSKLLLDFFFLSSPNSILGLAARVF